MTSSPQAPLPSAAARAALALMGLYQRWISPALPRRCRYYPTCSAYAVEAIKVHGALKGTVLAAWRLLRCNPLTRGGVDHVPDPGRWRYQLPPDVPRFAANTQHCPDGRPARAPRPTPKDACCQRVPPPSAAAPTASPPAHPAPIAPGRSAAHQAPSASLAS